MKTPDSALHEIIHSLSIGERRNFIQWATAQGRVPNYLVLFKAIQAQKNYNEAQLKEEYPEFRSHSNFSVKKKELFDAILRSLREMGTGKNKPITAEIEEINILMERGQFSKALTKVHYCKNICRERELFHESIILLRLERKCYRNLDDPADYPTTVIRIENEIDQVLKLKENLDLFERAYETDFYVLINSFNTSREIGSALISKLAENPIFQSEEATRSVRALQIFHSVLKVIERSKNDFSATLHHTNQLIGLFESNTFLMEEDFNDYLRCLVNQANLFLYLGETTTAMEVATKIKNLTPPNASFKERIILSYFWVILPASNDNLFPKLRQEEINTLVELILTKQSYFPKATLMHNYYLLGAHHFWNSDFAEARKWFEEITLANWGRTNLTLQGASRLLILFCYYELGKMDLFEINFGPTLRYLKKHQVFSNVAKLILKPMATGLSFDMRAIIRQLETNYPKELDRFNNYLNLIRWLEISKTLSRQS
ncbi:MAG: hypothetical protein H6581_29710 [Bacteroidia bacterium]|nr:hypothetical protein [Bacteroidia bacterium]